MSDDHHAWLHQTRIAAFGLEVWLDDEAEEREAKEAEVKISDWYADQMTRQMEISIKAMRNLREARERGEHPPKLSDITEIRSDLRDALDLEAEEREAKERRDNVERPEQ